jgi:predicted amidophosphoribosyltransferase
LAKLSKVDRLILESGDHYYLDDRDNCYFISEYTARRGFHFSETNNLIYNLKKSPIHRGAAQWSYKRKAIQQAGASLRAVLDKGSNANWLRAATLVPVPSSKIKSDEMHDNRLTEVLSVLGSGLTLDIRELVQQVENRPAAHDCEQRPKPDELRMNYLVDEGLSDPEPSHLGIFDDVLTSGAHFKAMKAILSERFPAASIIGIFLARRVPESDDPST